MITECKQVILRIKANSRFRHKVNKRDNELSFGTASFLKNRIKIEGKKQVSLIQLAYFTGKKLNNILCYLGMDRSI